MALTKQEVRDLEVELKPLFDDHKLSFGWQGSAEGETLMVYTRTGQLSDELQQEITKIAQKVIGRDLDEVTVGKAVEMSNPQIEQQAGRV